MLNFSIENFTQRWEEAVSMEIPKWILIPAGVWWIFSPLLFLMDWILIKREAEPVETWKMRDLKKGTDQINLEADGVLVQSLENLY